MKIVQKYILLVFICSISMGFAPATIDARFIWHFDTIEDELEIPRTTIYLEVDGKKYLIGKGTGIFRELDKASFNESQYQIPTQAITACTGFWAGLGHHIYVIQKGKKLEIKEGFLEAESKEGTRVKFKIIQKINL